MNHLFFYFCCNKILPSHPICSKDKKLVKEILISPLAITIVGDKKILLIIDDEKEVHELIREYLGPVNAEIYSAYNGEEGVKLYKELMAKNKKPDIVVMDLNLSGSRRYEDLKKQMIGKEMDGVKATEELLKIDKNANIIGFTAYAHLEWGEKLMEVGAKKVFGREIGFDGFAKAILKIISAPAGI